MLHAADSESFRLGVYKRFSLPGHPDGSLRRWKSGGSLAEQDAGGSRKPYSSQVFRLGGARFAVLKKPF